MQKVMMAVVATLVLTSGSLAWAQQVGKPVTIVDANAVKEALVEKFDFDEGRFAVDGVGWDRPVDPDQPDNIAGLTARDYAQQDARNTAIAKLFADTPKKTRAAVAGPKF